MIDEEERKLMEQEDAILEAGMKGLPLIERLGRVGLHPLSPPNLVSNTPGTLRRLLSPVAA